MLRHLCQTAKKASKAPPQFLLPAPRPPWTRSCVSASWVACTSSKLPSFRSKPPTFTPSAWSQQTRQVKNTRSCLSGEAVRLALTGLGLTLAPRPRRAGRPLDVKKSSFKKLSKLLDAFEKKKVLVQKVVRKQDCISSVNRESPEYLAHAAVPAPGAVPAAEAPKNSGTRMGSVTVAPCYRVPSSIRPIWGTGEDAGDKADVFTEEEVRAAAALYAERGGLLRQEGKATAIDAKQRSLLYGKKEVVPEELPLAALQARYLAKLTLHHRVLSRGPDGAERVTLRRGGLPIVSVSAEKRRGHAVTVVQHVEAFGLDASDVCSALQKQFQTSCKCVLGGLGVGAGEGMNRGQRTHIDSASFICRISEGPSKQDDDMLLTLQGDHSKGVSDILTQTYCIPKECIKASGLK